MVRYVDLPVYGSAMRTEITSHLDQRFKLLTGGRRTAVTRHQTLRSTVDWSYDLLEESERSASRRLAVFAGEFDLTVAEAVLAGGDLEPFEVLDLLLRLVEKSLVVAERQMDKTRYRLLETIRDYAWERLEETGETQRVSMRHATHFLTLAQEVGKGLQGRDEVAWMQRIGLVEQDNLLPR